MKIIISVVVLAVVGGAVYFVAGRSTEDTPTTESATTQSDTAENVETPADAENPTGVSDAPQAETATITFNGSGFSPASTTVKVGATIKVVNASSSALEFVSDPHPVHTDNTELNIGEVAPGQSKSFTVNAAGTWGIHNHENENQTATIVVQ